MVRHKLEGYGTSISKWWLGSKTKSICWVGSSPPGHQINIIQSLYFFLFPVHWDNNIWYRPLKVSHLQIWPVTGQSHYTERYNPAGSTVYPPQRRQTGWSALDSLLPISQGLDRFSTKPLKNSTQPGFHWSQHFCRWKHHGPWVQKVPSKLTALAEIVFRTESRLNRDTMNWKSAALSKGFESVQWTEVTCAAIAWYGVTQPLTANRNQANSYWLFRTSHIINNGAGIQNMFVNGCPEGWSIEHKTVTPPHWITSMQWVTTWCVCVWNVEWLSSLHIGLMPRSRAFHQTLDEYWLSMRIQSELLPSGIAAAAEHQEFDWIFSLLAHNCWLTLMSLPLFEQSELMGWDGRQSGMMNEICKIRAHSRPRRSM